MFNNFEIFITSISIKHGTESLPETILAILHNIQFHELYDSWELLQDSEEKS